MSIFDSINDSFNNNGFFGGLTNLVSNFSPIGSAVNGIIGLASNIGDRARTRKLQDSLFEREDTSYQRTVADMIKAGLSPSMLGNVNGSGAVVQSPAFNSDAFNDIDDSLNSSLSRKIMNTQNNQAQLDYFIDQQTKLTKALTEIEEQQRKIKAYDDEKKWKDVQLSLERQRLALEKELATVTKEHETFQQKETYKKTTIDNISNLTNTLKQFGGQHISTEYASKLAGKLSGDLVALGADVSTEDLNKYATTLFTAKSQIQSSIKKLDKLRQSVTNGATDVTFTYYNDSIYVDYNLNGYSYHELILEGHIGK